MSNAECTEKGLHPQALKIAQEAMPGEGIVGDTSSLFKMMGDPTRMSMIIALQATELCVCDLAELTGVSQSAVSHQLRVLRQARLVSYRREGKNAFYTLQDEHVHEIVKMALQHVAEMYKPENEAR